MIQSQGKVIAEVWSLDKNTDTRANAARIVACVNAFEGIEDPIKMREIWDIVKHLELDAYHKMKEQRDQLLSALEMCKDVIQRGNMYYKHERDAYAAASAAIANAKGGNS